MSEVIDIHTRQPVPSIEDVIEQAIFDQRVEDIVICLFQLEKCLLDILKQDRAALLQAISEFDMDSIIDICEDIRDYD